MKSLLVALVAGAVLITTVPALTLAHTGYEPKQIRVCKPRADCLAGGGSRYTVLFETYYLQRVLPNEWTCSWDADAVKSGAVAVRT